MSEPTLPILTPSLPSLMPEELTRPTAQGAEAVQDAESATFAELLESAATRAGAPTEVMLPLSPFPSPDRGAGAREGEGTETEATPTKPRRASAPGASPLAEAMVLVAPLPLPLSIPPAPPVATPGDAAQQTEEAAAPPHGLPASRDPALPPVGVAQAALLEEGTQLPAFSFQPAIADKKLTAHVALRPPSVPRPPLEVVSTTGAIEPATAQITIAAGSPGAPEPATDAILSQGSASGVEQAPDNITLSDVTLRRSPEQSEGDSEGASEGQGVSQGGNRSPVAFVPKLEPVPNPVTPYPASRNRAKSPVLDSPVLGRGPIAKGDSPPSSDPLSGSATPVEIGTAHSRPVPGQTEAPLAVTGSANIAPQTGGTGGSVIQAQASGPPPSSAPAPATFPPSQPSSPGSGLPSAWEGEGSLPPPGWGRAGEGVMGPVHTDWAPGSESSPSVIPRPPSVGDEVRQGNAHGGPTPPPLTEPPRMPPGEVPPVAKTRPPTPEPLPQPMGNAEPPGVSEQPPAGVPPSSPPPWPSLLEGRQTGSDGDDLALRSSPLTSGPQPKPEQHHPSGPLPPERGPAVQGEAQQLPGRYHPSGPLPPERGPTAEETQQPFVPTASTGSLPPPGWGRAGEGVSEAAFSAPPDATHELRFVSQVASHVERRARSGVSRAALRLYPEALGRVDVHLRLDSNGLILRLNAETLEAGALFERHLDQLRDALIARGVNVQELSVSVGTGFHMSANTYSGRQAPPGAETLPPPVPPARHSAPERTSSAPPPASAGGMQEGSLVDYRV